MTALAILGGRCAKRADVRLVQAPDRRGQSSRGAQALVLRSSSSPCLCSNAILGRVYFWEVTEYPDRTFGTKMVRQLAR